MSLSLLSIRTLHVLFTFSLVTFLTLPVAHAAEFPPGVKTMLVNGYDMAYVENGSGRPLIMVHGAMTDYRVWATQMEPLGQRNRAVAVSLRHYFPERWDGKGGKFSWQQHVADLISFIKTRVIDKPRRTIGPWPQPSPRVSQSCGQTSPPPLSNRNSTGESEG